MDYIAEARLTCSPSWHGDKVDVYTFFDRIQQAVAAANRVDELKKTLFYGKDNDLRKNAAEPDCSRLPTFGKDVPGGDPVGVDLIHGVLGVFTEAGEMLEALLFSLENGVPVDKVNLAEEVGDAFWYQAIIAFRTGFTFEQLQRINIAKLRRRFPDRFTEYDANNRDLAAERTVLEGGVPTDVAEQALPAHHRTRKMPGERNQDGDAIEAQKPA